MDNAPHILIFFLVSCCLAVVTVFAIARANKTYKDRKVTVSLILLILLLVVFGITLQLSYDGEHSAEDSKLIGKKDYCN